MVDINRKIYERNDIETIADNDGILRLNEKHTEELDHKNLREITTKYHSDHRKHRYELVEEQMKQRYRIFIDEKLAIKVNKKTPAHKFRTRLGFKQYDIILTKEQSVLTQIMNSLEGENIQTQNNVLSYRIDL